MNERKQAAYELGKKARKKHGIRASPFYEEYDRVNGRKVDVTDALTKCFLAGFDGEKLPME